VRHFLQNLTANLCDAVSYRDIASTRWRTKKWVWYWVW